uniref:Condensin-2 complex subunit D3 n=1 Tax=Electrophorus electricus TaxID=8005 RepID=A0A4W4G7Q2_ELEEL
MRAVQLLKLNAVSAAWVDTVWDFEFADIEPLDTAIEEDIKEDSSVFKKVYKQLLPLSNDNDNTESVWKVFAENGVSVKTLVAVLASFVLGGKAKSPSVEQRRYSLQAAALYLLLLRIPGSVANKVFHQILFDTCLDVVLKCWPQSSGKKRKKDSLKSSQGDPKSGKRSKPPKKASEEMEIEEEEEEEEDEEEVYFSAQDLLRLRDDVICLVRTLLRLLERFSLKDKPQSADSCVRVSVPPREGGRCLPELAYRGFWLLCSSSHGEGNEVGKICTLLCFRFYKRIKCAEYSTPCVFCSHVVDEQPEAALPLLRILLQHICHQVKTEYRASGAQAVGRLVAKMPLQDYATFVKWLHSYSHSPRVAFRMFALDVALVLLAKEEQEDSDALPPELAPYLSHRFLVHHLVYGRCSDLSPTVRGHALHCLAQCLDLSTPNTSKGIHELFSSSSASTLLHISLTTTAIETVALFRQRVSDPKTNVRKCALETIMSLLKHGVIPCSPENLAILSDRCRDPAVSVKKKALQSLMGLLAVSSRYFMLPKAWLRGVVPAVIDSESSVQEKALECLDHVILTHIKSHINYRQGDTSQRLAWDLLRMMCDKCHDLRCVSHIKAFSVWARQQRFTSEFVNSLIWHTEGDRAPGAWLLLAKVAGSASKLKYGTILEAWDCTVRSPVVNVEMTCHILSVIGHIAASLDEDTKSRLVADLMGWLKSFSLPLEVISSSVDAIFCLGQSANSFLNEFCGELVSVCEDYLSGVLLSEKGAENLNEELLVKYLYTLGVASLHCPARVQKRVFLLVQSILTSSEQTAPEGGADLPASQPLTQFKSSLPTVVRAHAVITLGKLCLQHEEVMLRYLPAFARELEVGTELAVRNNVVVVMCDLCVRYPNTLTRYIPNISACLRDPEPLIRGQTLIMLTNLLQEEFVKWKGTLFYRFTAVLVDQDPSIADLCEYCLVDLLLKKNPLMFSQHFIECIFHFNSYDKHKKYNKFPQTESEKSRFSLKGPVNQGRRFRIYRFLLKNFTDEQRFNITTRISQDVLACFVDSELPLDLEGADLLADVFDVLSLKEMKLTVMSGPSPGDDTPEDEMAAAKAVLQKKLVSQVQKKNFVENVIPMVIALKNLLEEQRSPVLKHLMAYLQATMQDYRSEVKELFAADEQLAAEVEFNLKMFEKQKQQELEQQLSNVTLSPRPKVRDGQPPPPPTHTRSHTVVCLCSGKGCVLSWLGRSGSAGSHHPSPPSLCAEAPTLPEILRRTQVMPASVASLPASLCPGCRW